MTAREAIENPINGWYLTAIHKNKISPTLDEEIKDKLDEFALSSCTDFIDMDYQITGVSLDIFNIAFDSEANQFNPKKLAKVGENLAIDTYTKGFRKVQEHIVWFNPENAHIYFQDGDTRFTIGRNIQDGKYYSGSHAVYYFRFYITMVDRAGRPPKNLQYHYNKLTDEYIVEPFVFDAIWSETGNQTTINDGLDVLYTDRAPYFGKPKYLTIRKL